MNELVIIVLSAVLPIVVIVVLAPWLVVLMEWLYWLWDKRYNTINAGINYISEWYARYIEWVYGKFGRGL